MDINWDQINAILTSYGLRVLGALIALIIGWWLIKLITVGAERAMIARKLNETLIPFLKAILNVALKIMLFIAILGMFGVKTASFVAILAAISFAIGMALSGTLQNFAGGVMLVIFKPFKVGDFIEAQGYSGSVKNIAIFNTIITTGDKKTVILPNGPLSTGARVNYSTEPQRRVDLTFGIGYDDDIDQARNTINAIIAAEQRILKDPEPVSYTHLRAHETR